MDASRTQRDQAIHALLRRLEQYATLSPFSRLFYRMIYEGLVSPRRDMPKLGQAFHLLLRCEARRHRLVAQIVHSGELDLPRALQTGQSIRWVLDRLILGLQQVEVNSRPEAMLRELLFAQCAYHLGQSEDVVHALRRAIGLGCVHPLVHFALGYNMYSAAVQRFSLVEGRVRIDEANREAFDRACREAIGAFRQGLGDRRFDAEIHWRIGAICEVIGDWSGAVAAVAAARELDPDRFGERSGEKLRHLQWQAVAGHTPAERERFARLGPISEGEIAEARRTLAAADAFPAVFLDPEE